jgi:hypothetical protein
LPKRIEGSCLPQQHRRAAATLISRSALAMLRGSQTGGRMRPKWCAALSILLLAWSGTAQAGYPERSVRIVIAFSAGGTIDTLGRILAQKLSEAWGQSVVIENRAGGGGNICRASIRCATSSRSCWWRPRRIC